ncbi:hypothetical protein L7F22_054608 [Adiantum nelumboides]|nr:hypothetical protein [Adiantum nelumboides]
MDHVGGIAQQGETLGPEGTGDAEGQGMPARAVLQREGPEIQGEPPLDLGQHLVGPAGQQGLGVVRTLGPDDGGAVAPGGRRPAVAGWRTGLRAGNARRRVPRGPGMADGRHDADLRVGPADPADPRRLAQPRARPVGGHQQIAPQGLAGRQHRTDRRTLRHRGARPRGDDRHPRPRQASARASASGSASIMWAKGSSGSRSSSASRPKVRKTGRTGSARRLSLMTISVIGSAASATRGHRRGGRASAAARREGVGAAAMPPGIGAARIDHRHGERRSMGMLERQGQGEAGQAAAGDQEAAAAGSGRLGRHRGGSPWVAHAGRVDWCIRKAYVARGQRTETPRVMTDANTDAMTDAVAELIAILDLERLEVDLFRGQNPKTGWRRGLRRAGGGAGAGRRDADGAGRPPAHSLHAYFLLPGTPDADRLRGRAHPRRRQLHDPPGQGDPARAGDLRHDRLLSGRGRGPDAPAGDLPAVAGPEGAPRRQGPGGRRRHRDAGGDRGLFRSRAADRPAAGRPEPLPARGRGRPGPRPIFNVWLRAASALPDDPALHRAVLAYASDMTLLDVSLIPHARSVFDPAIQAASLDHALWFHRPVRIDDWLLYAQDSPVAGGARGFARGQIFDRAGNLVASVAQEGLIRPIRD